MPESRESFMHFDVAKHVGAITREVRDEERDGKPARTVIATRRFDTDIDEIWAALTSAECIPRWFMPITGDLRLGGRYQLEGNAEGTITECAPPHRLAVTWEFGGGISWVQVTLAEEQGGGTRLELEHIAILDAEFEKFWDQFGPGAVGVGWDLSILGLAEHLENGFTVAPESNAAWLASENYKEFVGGSSAGWRDGSIAFGTDPEAAGQAGGRTTDFYTAG